MWACGSPRPWNSIIFTMKISLPNFFWRMSCNLWRRSLKARATIIGMSYAVCPWCSLKVISGHLALQVMVMNSEGRPNSRVRASESAVSFEAHSREPRKDAGSQMSTRSSSQAGLLSWAWEIWPLWMNCSRSSSIREYISQIYSDPRWLKSINRGSLSKRLLYHCCWVKGSVFLSWKLSVALGVKPHPGVLWGKKTGYCSGS